MSNAAAWHIPEWTMGDRLRKAREDAGLSQMEMADTLGVSRSTISNAELGIRVPLKITLRAWAVETGVPVEWLVEGRTNPEPPPARGRRRVVAEATTDTRPKRYSRILTNARHPAGVAA